MQFGEVLDLDQQIILDKEKKKILSQGARKSHQGRVKPQTDSDLQTY